MECYCPCSHWRGNHSLNPLPHLVQILSARLKSSDLVETRKVSHQVILLLEPCVSWISCSRFSPLTSSFNSHTRLGHHLSTPAYSLVSILPPSISMAKMSFLATRLTPSSSIPILPLNYPMSPSAVSSLLASLQPLLQPLNLFKLKSLPSLLFLKEQKVPSTCLAVHLHLFLQS